MSHNAVAFLWTFTCPWILIKRVKLLIKKANFEGIVLLSKALLSEGLAELQCVIDSFVSLANQIILNNSNKDCDWLILTCFREQYRADATFSPLANKVWFENSANVGGYYWILYYKTSKEDSTVLCSVVKYLGS